MAPALKPVTASLNVKVKLIGLAFVTLPLGVIASEGRVRSEGTAADAASVPPRQGALPVPAATLTVTAPSAVGVTSSAYVVPLTVENVPAVPPVTVMALALNPVTASLKVNVK